MEVKTNKEYTAMLHEIEAVEREIRAREDQILAEMEKAEALAADVKREEAAFKAAEAPPRDEGRALDERAEALRQEAGSARAPSATPWPRRSRRGRSELFQRVAKLRGVGRGRGEGRHVPALPREAAAADVRGPEAQRRRSSSAPSCSRILFYEPPAPVVAPQP